MSLNISKISLQLIDNFVYVCLHRTVILIPFQTKKTSRFKRRSELSVTSDGNPQEVYVIHLSAVLLNPRDCPQLVDFILDKPVIMVEIGVVYNKGTKSCGPREVIEDPEIDWDDLDITQQGQFPPKYNTSSEAFMC